MPIGIRVVERPDVRVKIDIKPGEENTIIPAPRGASGWRGFWRRLRSAFDRRLLCPLGPGEAAAIRYETWDFNGDGAGDLALRFSIPDAAIQCGDAEAMMAGRTIDGQSLAATDYSDSRVSEEGSEMIAARNASPPSLWLYSKRVSLTR